MGLIVGPKASSIAFEKAEKVGSGWVSVQNSNHFGIAGYYTLKAQERGLIGLAMTNTSPIVTPCFGKQGMLGTNPISVTFPANEEPPIVVDMATSVVAYGTIEECIRKGEPIPTGWAQDQNGVATTRATIVKEGGKMLGLGSDRLHSSHKGYCLSSTVDILCGVLSGANWGPNCPGTELAFRKGNQGSRGKGIGHFFGAWKIDGFRDPTEFRNEIDLWRRTFSACEPLDAKQPVLIPGDPEWNIQNERKVHGIPIKWRVALTLQTISKTTGVQLPDQIRSFLKSTGTENE